MMLCGSCLCRVFVLFVDVCSCVLAWDVLCGTAWFVVLFVFCL